MTIGALACDIDADSLCDVEEERERDAEVAPTREDDEEVIESEAMKARCALSSVRCGGSRAHDRTSTP